MLFRVAGKITMVHLSHLAQALAGISCANTTSVLFSKYFFKKCWHCIDLREKNLIVNHPIHQKKKKKSVTFSKPSLLNKVPWMATSDSRVEETVGTFRPMVPSDFNGSWNSLRSQTLTVKNSWEKWTAKDNWRVMKIKAFFSSFYQFLFVVACNNPLLFWIARLRLNSHMFQHWTSVSHPQCLWTLDF